MKALLEMRRSAKEKELEAMLSGEHDSCSCFIEVTFSAVLAAIQWIFVILAKFYLFPLRENSVSGVQLLHHLSTSYPLLSRT